MRIQYHFTGKRNCSGFLAHGCNNGYLLGSVQNSSDLRVDSTSRGAIACLANIDGDVQAIISKHGPTIPSEACQDFKELAEEYFS